MANPTRFPAGISTYVSKTNSVLATFPNVPNPTQSSVITSEKM